MADSKRVAFMAWLMEQHGRPYIWAGKTGDPGWDCSGLVTAGIFAMGGPDWREWNARALFDKLLPIEKEAAQPGDLVLYGPPEGHMHVMAYWGPEDGRVFGATGGDHTCTRPEIAIARGAMVKFKLLGYRPDLRGFRSAPFPPFYKEISDV